MLSRRVKAYQIEENNLAQGDWYSGKVIEDTLPPDQAAALTPETLWETAGLLNRCVG